MILTSPSSTSFFSCSHIFLCAISSPIRLLMSAILDFLWMLRSVRISSRNLYGSIRFKDVLPLYCPFLKISASILYSFAFDLVSVEIKMPNSSCEGV